MLILLGDTIQDNQGTQWLVTQEVRHFQSPDITRLVLKEKCLATRQPRTAICKNDGTELIGESITADKIMSICNKV